MYTPDCTRLHTPSLPNWTLPFALDGTLPACLTYTREEALKMLPSTLRDMISRMLPVAPDGTPSVCLTVRSPPRSQDALEHTSKHTFKYTPNCTRWHTPSLHECRLPSKLPRSSQAYSQTRSQIYFQLHLMTHTQPAWLYPLKYTPSMLPGTPRSTFSSTLPGMLSSTLPVALNRSLPACLTVWSPVCSQDALKHTPEHALKYTPNSTWLYTSRLLDSTLPSTLSRGKTLSISLDYMPWAMLQHARLRDMLSCRCQVPRGVKMEEYGWRRKAGNRQKVCGMWQVPGDRQCMLAKIMMSVNIIVWTLSLAQPPRQDLTMS